MWTTCWRFPPPTNKFESGYLGLMTFGGSVTYQDVKYTDLGDGATAPGLTGLEVTGSSLELTPEFDPDVSNYTYFAGYADSITVTPSAADDVTLTIAATGPEGEIFAAEAIASGDSKEIPLQVGSNTVSHYGGEGRRHHGYHHQGDQEGKLRLYGG